MRTIIGFDECDTPDEVCAWLNKIRADQDLIEGHTMRLSKEVDTLKRQMDSRVTKSWVANLLSPKKGNKVKSNGSTSIRIIAALVILVSAITLCYSAYKTTDINYEIASNPELLSTYLRDSFGNMTSSTYLFTPGSQPSVADSVEGKVYYSSDTHSLFLYDDGGWTELDKDSVDGYSLDSSYNEGYAIDVDGTAVTLTVRDAQNNIGLIVSSEEIVNNNTAVQILLSSSHTGIALDIDGRTTAWDIKGTGDSFTVTGAGIVDLVGLTVGAEDITLENGAKILNVTPTEIQFIEDYGSGDENFSIDFLDDALALKSSSGVDSLDFGPIDDLIGVGTIVFDDATGAAITMTAGTGTYDLTISQAGTAAVSLIMSSAGAAVDALSLFTTDAAGVLKIESKDYTIDIDAADGMTIDVVGTAGEDLVITNTGGSISIIATENQANAIVIDASNAAGGIDIDAGTGNIDIDILTGDFLVDCDLFSIDGTGVANITVTADAGSEDFTIAQAGSTTSNLILSSAGTAANALQITTTAGGIDILNGGASGGEDIDITSTSASVNITAGEAVAEGITIGSAGGIDITADGASGKDLDLVCTSGSTNLSGGEADQAAVVIAAASGGIDITSGGAGLDIDITATGGTVQIIATEAAVNQFKVSATGTIGEGTGDAIVLETTNGGIKIEANDSTNGDIELDAADDLIVTAAGDIVFTIGGVARIIDDDILSFGTDDDITIAYDENGDDNLQIIGPVDLETTYVEFRESPVTSALEGGVPGTTGTNLMVCGYPACTFEYFIIGTQTKTAPIIGDYGLDIGMDDATSDGAEITEGITVRCRSAFETGATGQYLEVVYYTTDEDGAADLRIGFRQAMAYDATIDNYDEMWAVGVKGTDWYSWTINNDATTEEVDLDPSDVTDGESHTVRIEIAQTLDVTIYIDGATPGNMPITPVETGEILIPFFYYIHHSETAEGLMITSWECGAL